MNFYAIEDSQVCAEEVANEQLQQLRYLEEVFIKAGEDDQPKDVRHPNGFKFKTISFICHYLTLLVIF